MVGLKKLLIKILQQVPFRFGIDENGNYGYYKEGADTVTPFNREYIFIDGAAVQSTSRTWTATKNYRSIIVVFCTGSWAGSKLVIRGQTYYNSSTRYHGSEEIFYANGSLGLIGYKIDYFKSGESVVFTQSGCNGCLGICVENY